MNDFVPSNDSAWSAFWWVKANLLVLLHGWSFDKLGEHGGFLHYPEAMQRTPDQILLP